MSFLKFQSIYVHKCIFFLFSQDKLLNMSHAAREDLYTSEYPFCKSPLLDRRMMALKYSETFKISSRAEASMVLKLTQKLSDSLEQYFLNSKGLEILPSSNYGNGKLASTSRNLQKVEAHDEIPFVSSQSVEQKSGDGSCVSQINLNSSESVKVNAESKPRIVSHDLEMKTKSDLSMENDESDFDASSLHSSSSQESPSSSQAQRKTPKTLSPDILQLLKGKDANTVTNILKTLSPFYPALQDVNLEILAQVLVNTGALD